MAHWIKKSTKSLSIWIRQPSHIILVIILIVAIIFRFWNTPDRFGFDKDPTRDVLITEHIASSFQFPLVGPSSGIAPFTFGPWYYYELAFFRLLVPTPYAAFYFVPFFSLLLILLMYWIGKELKDKILGLILAGLTALTPSQVGPTSGLSNPNLIPPHAAATIFIFIIMMSKKRSARLAFIWGIILGVGINHHYELVPLLIFPIIAFCKYIRSSLRSVLLFILGLFLTFIPLLVFNLQNNFETARNMFIYVTKGNGIYIPNSWMIYIKDFWAPYWAYVIGVPVWLGLLFVAGVFIVYLILLWQRKISHVHIIIGLVFIVLFIGLRFTSFQREYYYFLFLLPFLLLFAGMFLRTIWDVRGGKIVFCILAGVMLVTSFPMNKMRLNSPEDNKKVRSDAQILNNTLSTKGVVIYNCQENQINRAEGFTFYLIKEGKFNPNGQKIAFQDTSKPCVFSSESLTELAPGIVDASTLSDENLEKNGWFKITPQTVYTKTFGSR